MSIREQFGKTDFMELARRQQLKELNDQVQQLQTTVSELEKKNTQLTDKLDTFYGRLMELFGVFIAIFSFIIAGIQIASKAEGGFWKQLGTSGAIFIPVTICIVALLLTIRWTSRR